VAVESAQHDLTTAQIALDQATLLTPMTGTLTSLPWSVGDTASTGDVATVTAGDATRMTIEVAESAIASVAVGQAAVVTSTTGTETPGKVSSIGLLPSESSTSSVTYPVTVVVQQRGDGLTEGTTASARVTVASAADAVIVPMSAVTLTGLTEGTVTVLGAGATTSTARVSLGVRGGTHLEITGGLNAGDTVVLADTSAAIPTSTTVSPALRSRVASTPATRWCWRTRAPRSRPVRRRCASVAEAVPSPAVRGPCRAAASAA